MRTLSFVLAATVLTACSFNDQSLRDRRAASPGGFTLEEAPLDGFQRLADSGNPGLGVVPVLRSFDGEPVPSAWASMGDRLCAIDGATGGIRQDIFLDDEEEAPVTPVPDSVEMHDADADTGIFLLESDYMLRAMDADGNGLNYPVLGEVADARLRPGRAIVTLTETWDGCSVVERSGGTMVHHPLGIRSCGEGTLQLDDSSESPRIWALADGELFLVEKGEVNHIGQETLFSVDPRTGHRVSAVEEDVLLVEIDDVQHGIGFDAPVVDATLRGDHMVALTADGTLHLTHVPTGKPLGTATFYGDTESASLELTADGEALVAVGEFDLTFYRLFNSQD